MALLSKLKTSEYLLFFNIYAFLLVWNFADEVISAKDFDKMGLE